MGLDLFAYNRMGKTILRKSPGKRKKSSEMQETCMNSFGLMSEFYSFVKRQLALPIWKLAGAKYGKMANNYFAQVNKGIFNSEGGIRDFDELVLSEGTLLNPDRMTVEPAGDGVFRVCWTAEDECRTRGGTDKLMVLILPEMENRNLEFGLLWAENVAGKRGDGTGTFTLPVLREEYRVHIYCFFGTADGTAYSRSKHFLVG